MSRIVTASEVDRLHQQVAELQQQVRELQQAPNLTPSKSAELFEVSGEQETRSAADPVVDVLASESPSAI